MLSEAKRDPRRDPKAGDVLLFPYEGTAGEKQQVIHCHNSGVIAQPINFIAGVWQVMWDAEDYTMEEWVQIAKNAEVLHAAE